MYYTFTYLEQIWLYIMEGGIYSILSTYFEQIWLNIMEGGIEYEFQV